MAVQTDTYANLISLIEALAGTSLETTEKARLQHLINRRAFKAFRATQYWPNMLTVGERRPVRGANTIAFDDVGIYSFFESGYKADAEIDTLMRVHKDRPFRDQGVEEFEFYAGPDNASVIGFSRNYDLDTHTDSLGDTLLPTITGVAGTAWVLTYDDSTHYVKAGDFLKVSGFDTTSADINQEWEVYSVTGGTVLIRDSDAVNATISPGSDAAVKISSAWCTYKKRLTDTYGENDTTTVPLEWFEYMAHGAYADFLRADGQTEKAMGEEGFAKQILQDELERIEAQHYASTIGKRIQTHTSRAARFSSVR